jgi:hypothetical protein
MTKKYKTTKPLPLKCTNLNIISSQGSMFILGSALNVNLKYKLTQDIKNHILWLKNIHIKKNNIINQVDHITRFKQKYNSK